MIMINGSSGRLMARPIPIFSTLMETGTRKHNNRSSFSRSNSKSIKPSSATGNKFNHIKPEAIATRLSNTKEAESR